MFSFQKKVVRVKEREREGEYVLFRNKKKKNNDNSNNKLTKEKVTKAQRKLCFTKSRVQLRFTEKLKKRLAPHLLANGAVFAGCLGEE